MLAISTLVLICIEVIVYGSLGLFIAGRMGWGTWTAALAIPLAMCLVRFLIVLRAFIVSSRFTTEESEVRRIGFLGWCKLVLHEWRGTLLLYSVLQPLERFINRRDAPDGASGTPVLLVHGLVCNGGAWWWMKRALARRGITCLYTMNLEPVLGSIDTYGPQLARRVEEICAATGRDKVILVGHSMGGLAARVYLDRCGGAKRVAALLTLGSPHHGTALARPSVGENIRQMQLNSSWLAALNEGESQPAPVPVTSIYTAHDNLVSPQSGCRLGNAANMRLIGIGHVALQFSEDVADLVADFVARHSIPEKR